MKEYHLRFLLATILTLSHVATAALICYLFFRGGFTFDEMTTALGVLVPALAVYASAAFTWMLDPSSRQRVVAAPTAIASLLFPIMYFVALFSVTIAKSRNSGFQDFNQYKVLIVALEGFFGVYVGRVVKKWFGPLGPVAAPGANG